MDKLTITPLRYIIIEETCDFCFNANRVHAVKGKTIYPAVHICASCMDELGQFYKTIK